MTRPSLRARPALTATLVAGLLTAAVPAVAAPGDPVPEPPAPASPSAELPDAPRFPRTSGPDREATAVRVSRLAFPDGASVAYVATSRTYADALAGGPLAASDDAPLLLVNPAGLDDVVAGEIARLGVDEVVVLGGTAAVPAAVEAQIADLGVATSRIQGTDRFQTARRIAQRLTGGSADTVFVVEGQDPDPGRGWPDAVSVSAYAAHVGAPIVPVVTDAVPAASQALLDGLGASEVVLVGGTAAISAAVEAALAPSDEEAGVTVRRLAGADRFATSAAVYDEAVTRGLDPTHRWLATGAAFPDALTGGAAAGHLGYPMLLVDPTDATSHEATVQRLTAAPDLVDVVRFLGGTAAISAASQAAIEDLFDANLPAADLCLTVLHNNDGESQLIDAGSGLEEFGGAARFATRLLTERARGMLDRESCEDTGVLTVTSGDNFLAGPEFNASREAGVPYYDSKLYDYLNYDAIDLGNHDFDFGTDVTAEFIQGFSDDTPFLSANLDFSADVNLQDLADSGRIAPSTTVEMGDHRIGVIGLTTPTLRSISSPGDDVEILGLTPSGEVDLDALAGIVNDEATGLVDQGVDIVVLISHMQDVDTDLALVSMLEDVDIAVAGGGDEILGSPGEPFVPGDETQVAGSYPIEVDRADGTMVPVVTTAGSYKYVGRLVTRFDAGGDLLGVDPWSRMVRVAGGDLWDAVTPDAWVQANVVDPVVDAVADLAEDVIATTSVPLDGKRERVRTQETNIGDLVADAYVDAAQDRGADFGIDASAYTVGLVNGGGIRNDSVIEPGDVTRLDTFDISPFGNFVAVFEDVTPAELDEVLEHAYSGAPEEVAGRFAQVSNLHVVIDTSAAVGSRVTLTQPDGSPLPTSFNLALPDFTARGGDDYPVGGLGEFTSLGVTDQQALAAYIVEDLAGTIDAADYPDLQATQDGPRIEYA